jgi:hypothetical protein
MVDSQDTVAAQDTGQNAVNAPNTAQNTVGSQDMVDPQDLKSWRRAYELHGRKFVHLVNDRHPLKDLVYRTLRLPGPGPEDMGDEHFGFRIYLADCQRMYMRYLQHKLIRVVVSLHQDETMPEENLDDTILTEENSKCLEDALKKYSMSTTAT